MGGDVSDAPGGPRWLADSSADKAGRQPLTRRRVVETAVRLVDEHGLEALSMRKLASELGASQMTPYTYVRDKDELLDLMLDHVLGQIDLSGGGETDWVGRIRAMFRSYHNVLSAHPGIARIYGDGVKIGPNGVRAIEATLAVLREGGFAPRAAANAFYTLFNYTIGYHQIGRVNPLTEDSEATAGAGRVSATVSRFFSALPAEEVPTIVATARHLTGTRAGRRFEYGLDVLLAGLRERR